MAVALNSSKFILIFNFITTRKRSLGQGNIFSPVILFTGGSTWAGTPWAGTPSRYTPWQVHPLAGTPPWAGTPRQVHPPGQVHPLGKEHPPGAVHAGRYGQQVGGTHPTGMHSCFRSRSWFRYVRFQLSVQNVVSPQPCLRKLGISLVLLNFLGCKCGW